MCVCVLCVCARARALHIRPSDFSSLNLLGASDRSLRLAVRYLPSTLTRTCWPSTKPASASVMVSVIAVLPSPMMDLVATVGRDKAKRYERPPHVRPNRLRRTTSPLSTRPRTGRLPRCCRRPSRASRSSPPARCGGRAKAPAGRPLRGHVIGMRNEKCGMRNESECGMKQQNPSATSCHRYLAPRCPPPPLFLPSNPPSHDNECTTLPTANPHHRLPIRVWNPSLFSFPVLPFPRISAPVISRRTSCGCGSYCFVPTTRVTKTVMRELGCPRVVNPTKVYQMRALGDKKKTSTSPIHTTTPPIRRLNIGSPKAANKQTNSGKTPRSHRPSPTQATTNTSHHNHQHKPSQPPTQATTTPNTSHHNHARRRAPRGSERGRRGPPPEPSPGCAPCKQR